VEAVAAAAAVPLKAGLLHAAEEAGEAVLGEVMVETVVQPAQQVLPGQRRRLIQVPEAAEAVAVMALLPEAQAEPGTFLLTGKV
jgi:uncharacterized protein (DUF1778 family)